MSQDVLRIIPLDPTGIDIIGRKEICRDFPIPSAMQFRGRKGFVLNHPISS